MQQGKIDGTVKTYFRNGKIETEKEYRHSVESGRERRFDSKTGEQIFESHYIYGKKEGEELEIFENWRTLRSRTTRHYRNGKLDGSYRVESTRDGKPYITIEGQYTCLLYTSACCHILPNVSGLMPSLCITTSTTTASGLQISRPPMCCYPICAG